MTAVTGTEAVVCLAEAFEYVNEAYTGNATIPGLGITLPGGGPWLLEVAGFWRAECISTEDWANVQVDIEPPAFYNDSEGYWLNGPPITLGHLAGSPAVGTTWGPFPFRLTGVVKDQGGAVTMGDWFITAGNGGGAGGHVRITIDQMTIRAVGPTSP